MYLHSSLAIFFIIYHQLIRYSGCEEISKCVQNALCKCTYQRSWVQVDCSALGLSRLPDGIPGNTTSLCLDNNELLIIESDALVGFTHLKEISLNHNKLTLLPKFPKNIHVISANSNNIKSIDGSFANLTQLNRISLKDNPIRILRKTTFKNANFFKIELGYKLQAIEPYTFANISNLNNVIIRFSELRELVENSFFITSNYIEIFVESSPSLTNISTGTFKNIPNSSQIIIARCGLTSIPSRVIVNSTGALNWLNFNENNICNDDIDPMAFTEIRQVRSFSMAGNCLTTVPSVIRNFIVEDKLDLSRNRISSLGDVSLLNHCTLTAIYLDGNIIKNISRENFTKMKRLKTLFISQNKISYIENGAFDNTRLSILQLQGNELSHIKNGTFYNNNLLTDLYLYDNPLQLIDDSTFSYISKTSKVYLKCDDLLNIPSTVPSVKVICVKNTTEIIFDLDSLDHFWLGMVCNGTKCTPCKQGHFKIDNNKETECSACPPGGFYLDHIGTFEKSNYSSICKKCPVGSFSPNIGAGAIADCHPCPSGTKSNQQADLNACECLDNFHRVDRYGECKPCVGGLNCENGFQKLQPGYWWSWNFPAGLQSILKYKEFAKNLTINNFDLNNPDGLKETKYNGLLPAVHKCKRSKSCTGVDIEANCSRGYSGWLCATCSPNYYELFNECYECQNVFVVVIVLFVSVLVLTFTGYIVWRINQRKKIIKISSFFIHMKIAINFYQILGILSEVNEIHWPEDFQSVGESLQYLDIIRYINVLSPKCYFSHSWNAYTSLYIAIITPFAILIFLSLFFLFLYGLHRCRADTSEHHFKEKFVSATIMMMYLTYANTCSNIMAVGPWSIRTFNVTNDGNYTKNILTSDSSINLEADDGSVYNLNKDIVYVSLLYVIGFPIAVLILLYCVFKRNENLERPGYIGLKLFCKQYNKRFWFWEVIEMYNKAILSLIANFKDDQASNMSYSLFITVLLIMLHLYLEPMKEKSEQRFQLLAMVFILVNLSIGAIVDMDKTLYTADNTIAVLHDITPFVLLMLNVSILLVVFVELLKAIKETLCEGWNHHQAHPDDLQNLINVESFEN